MVADELRDPVTWEKVEAAVGRVEHDDDDLTAIRRVDDAADREYATRGEARASFHLEEGNDRRVTTLECMRCGGRRWNDTIREAPT